MKKIIVCMLAFVFLFCGITASAATAQGYAGKNIKWEVRDSSLFITGTGEMPDYSSWSSTPWYSYSSEIWNIYIDDGITSVGNYAFGALERVIGVYISDTVTKIGDYAFSEIIYLEELNIPSSVTEIGKGAFQRCEYVLESVTLKEGLEKIGAYAFSDCNALESVNIPASVTEIGTGAFDGTALKSITVNENNAYYCSDNSGVLYDKNKTKLVQYPLGKTETSYNVADSVTEICDYAFSECQNIQSVSMPSGIFKIGKCAFYYCPKLQSINIPSNLKELGYWAFNNCRALTGSIVMPRGITTVGDRAFSGCAIDSVEIYGNNAEYGEYVFNGCTALKDVKIKNGAMTGISDGMFYNCTALESIEIEEGPANVGVKSFYGCENLSVIQFPDSVADIGDMAFYDCTALKEIYFGSGFASYYNHNVFDSCRQLLKISVSGENENFCTDGYGVLMNKDKTKILYYPKGRKTDYDICDTVVEICEWAFAYVEFENLGFGKSMETIGSDAFYISKLKNITVDEENKNYASVGGVLYDKTKTKLIMYPFGRTEESYAVPDGTTEIGDGVFSNNSVLKKVTMPDSLRIIGKSAFSSCDSLCDVTIGKNVTEIKDFAFWSCDALENISVPGSVKTIGTDVFAQSGLKKAILCEGVTSLGKNMFYFCRKLETLVLSKSLSVMEDYSIYYCSALNNIFYAGTEAEFKKITQGEYVYYYLYKAGNKVYKCMPADLGTVSCTYKDNKVTVNISFEYAIQDGVAIFAVYDGKGRLINTESMAVTAGNTTKTIEMTADESYKNYTAKIMVWDGLDCAVPLSYAEETDII